MAGPRLLLPFDGSPAARRAVELVQRLPGDPVVLLNVQPRPVSLWPEGAIDVAALEAGLLQSGHDSLKEALAMLPAARPEVRLGFPAEAILREARAQAADIVVMGTRGAGLLDGFALGSVALRVAHGGACPTFLVKPQARLPAPGSESKGPRRILVALDGSPHALRAVDALLGWRGWLGEVALQLVHVQQPLTLAQQILPPHDDLMEQWSAAAAEEALRSARERLAAAGVAHRLHFSAGDPAPEIAQLAEDEKCELIVVGTRGRGAAHHAMVGSVALKVAARAAVPVALVA